MQDTMIFNGIDARSGGYHTPPLTAADVARLARGERLDKSNLAELRFRATQAKVAHFGVKEGVDPRRLEETGWGVIFPFVTAGTPEAQRQAAIREALRPLLDHRRAQANQKREYYREYVEANAYRPGETKQKFLARLGAGPGPADPEKVPYYLLLVGSPEEIPFGVQYQIDVQYAVGRIHFHTIEEYANYAQSVVRAETLGLGLPRRAAFFGVANPGDVATQMSAQHLVAPLADALRTGASAPWTLDRYMGASATKAQLSRLLGGADTPAVLFTASHGMAFEAGDPLQERHQGALLCQDWPGPKEWAKEVPQDFYFSADDVASNANLAGLIAFNFACYGAGTPEFDEFSKQAFKDRSAIAKRPFVAALQQKLLGHSKGGALAAIGHVERAWGYSFMWDSGGPRGVAKSQLAVFESTLKKLMDGYPVGSAVEYFNVRYAELASDLSARLEEAEFGPESDPFELAGMWTANNDARGYAVIGDPAVRLPLADSAERAMSREQLIVNSPLEASTLQSAPGTSTAAPTASVQQPAAAPRAASEPTLPSAVGSDPGLPSFGWLGGGDEKTGETGQNAFARFVNQLMTTLSVAVENAATLEVRTFVSDELDAVAKSGGKVALSEVGQLRAYTRIALDGDIDVCAPSTDGRLDSELWALHLDMVKQAQQHRTELIKTVFGALSGMIKP